MKSQGIKAQTPPPEEYIQAWRVRDALERCVLFARDLAQLWKTSKQQAHILGTGMVCWIGHADLVAR